MAMRQRGIGGRKLLLLLLMHEPLLLNLPIFRNPEHKRVAALNMRVMRLLWVDGGDMRLLLLLLLKVLGWKCLTRWRGRLI